MKAAIVALALTLLTFSACADQSKPRKPTTPTPSASNSGPETSAPAPVDTPATPETSPPVEKKVDETPAPEKSADAKPADGPQLAAADKPKASKAPSGPAPVVGIGPGDWGQWAGNSARNNAPPGKNIPSEWAVGDFDPKTGEWIKDDAKNIKWTAQLGSQTYGNPVIANGQVYVGSNNGAGYLKRYPASIDLGVLVCFDEKDGKFLWQDSSEKLPTGRVHDWPLQGICCAPLVEGDRLWYVTSRGEVKCLDTAGFKDKENDGTVTNEKEDALKKNPEAEWEEEKEADVVWVLNMMRELATSQHNMCSCSVTAAGDILFVNTSNGVDEGHVNLPAPHAPTFLAMDKNTGKVLWTDNSPGINVLHGQWSSPAYAVIKGVPQVIFGGGDGWLYSFLGEATPDGKAKLLWKFDCNPKKSKYALGGRADRNHIIGTPVIYEDLVFVGVGEDPEHGEGVGHLWCIDPTKSGDVSTELVFNAKDLTTPIPHKRMQACVEEEGDVARANPNSAAVWHYESFDKNGNGKLEFEESMHRTCGTVAIKDGLLFVADFSGLVHCLDVKTGKPHWTYDMLAASWGSPLVVDDKVYIGDEDGDVTVFRVSAKQEVVAENTMGTSVYTTPVVANDTLFIANKDHLFAIVPEQGE